MFCSMTRHCRRFRIIRMFIVACAVSLPGCAFDRTGDGPIARAISWAWPRHLPNEQEKSTSRSVATHDCVAVPTGEAVAFDRPVLPPPPSSYRPAEPNGGEASLSPPTIPVAPPSYPAIAAGRSTSDTVSYDDVLSSPRPPAQFVAQQTIPPATPATVPSSNREQRFVPPQPRIARVATTGMVLHASEDSFDEQVLKSNVPVLVDFYAKWCGPCRMLAPTLEELAKETPQARIVKIDVDDNPELAARYGVNSLPSLIVFKAGNITARQKGLVSKTRLQAMLDLPSDATFR
jgi:thioredoxin 1